MAWHVTLEGSSAFTTLSDASLDVSMLAAQLLLLLSLPPWPRLLLLLHFITCV